MIGWREGRPFTAKACLASVLVAAAALGPAAATDYYVRTDGNDANAGTGNSAAQAWASPAKCASATVKAGDRCLIQPGTYAVGSGITQVNGGALKTDNAMSSCTCTAKSTTISCGSAVTGVAVGDWVRCDGTGPTFNWTRVAAVSGATITLEEGYRGKSSAGATTLDTAQFVEVRGDGPEGSVTLTRTRPKPAGVTWTQSTAYPEVWSYAKSQAGGDGYWSAPKGMRQTNGPWDKWYANRSGRDAYVKVSVGSCPCSTQPTCEAHVARVQGTFCDDGTRVWVQTFGGGSPESLGVVASAAAIYSVGWSMNDRDYFAFRNIYLDIAGESNGYNTDSTFAFVSGGSNHLLSRVTAAGSACRFDLSRARTMMQVEHVDCLEKTTGVPGGAVSHSGLRFYDVEMRGGYSNGFSLDSIKGTSSTDRVIFDRIYLHRVFTWYRTSECTGDPIYNCSTESFSEPQWAAHGAYIGTSVQDNGLNYLLLQNSVIEVTGDGWAFFNGAGGDIVVRNNTFGASHAVSGNWRQEAMIFGLSGAAAGLKHYNNAYYVDADTGSDFNGSLITYGTNWTNVTTDYNLYLHPHNNSVNMATSTETFKGSGSGPDYSFDSINSSLGQERHGLFVCYSSCSSSASSLEFNDGADARSYFVKPSVSDGTISNYTPTSKNRGVNAGLNSECPGEDFYGNPRSDGACDIGAVELQGGPSDTTPPSPLTNFVATPGNAQVTLSWTHSTSADNKGALVRFKTTGYPTSPSDGSVACDELGAPGSFDSCVHSGLANGTTYYYAAFAYDAVPNYATAVQAQAQPSAPVNVPPEDVENLRRTDTK